MKSKLSNLGFKINCGFEQTQNWYVFMKSIPCDSSYEPGFSMGSNKFKSFSSQNKKHLNEWDSKFFDSILFMLKFHLNPLCSRFVFGRSTISLQQLTNSYINWDMNRRRKRSSFMWEKLRMAENEDEKKKEKNELKKKRKEM